MDIDNIYMASEARKLTNESGFLLKNAHKWIKEAAARNCDYIPLYKEEFDSLIFDSTIETLKSEGYKIKEDVETNTYYIRW